MADLLQLIADAEQAGEHVSTTTCRASSYGIGPHLLHNDVNIRFAHVLAPPLAAVVDPCNA